MTRPGITVAAGAPMRFPAVVCSAFILAASSAAPAFAEPVFGLGAPNMIVNGDRLQSSVLFRKERFRSTDCSVIEGSIGNEISPLPGSFPRRGVERVLMRFDVEIMNYADTDLIAGAPGDPDLYEFSPCHGHYHLRGFTRYELIGPSGVVISGRKQAFCLMDIRKWDSSAGDAKYTCSSQGISAGWSDVYDRSLDGQWLDITGVPPGTYTLRVAVDVGNLFAEASDDDNFAEVPVTIPARIR